MKYSLWCSDYNVYKSSQYVTFHVKFICVNQALSGTDTRIWRRNWSTV